MQTSQLKFHYMSAVEVEEAEGLRAHGGGLREMGGAPRNPAARNHCWV